MMRKIKEITNLYKTLELNKTTQDVDSDLKVLNFKKHLKYYGFYVASITVGSILFFGTLHLIEKDNFRRALIEDAGVNPLMSLTYSTYQDKLKDIKKEFDKTNQEIEKIQMNQNLHVASFNYSYSDFLKDIKNKKIKINFDKILKEQINDYKYEWIKTYLYQHNKEKIKLGKKEYTYYAISMKLRFAPSDQADQVADLPVSIIVKKLNMKETDTNKQLVKKALKSIAFFRYDSKAFYSKLKIKKDAKSELKKALLNGKNRYFIRSANYKIAIKLPKLDQEFLMAKKQAKEEYIKNMSEVEKKIIALKAKLKVLKEKREKLSKLMHLIQKLPYNLKNYKAIKNQIEKLLKDIK